MRDQLIDCPKCGDNVCYTQQVTSHIRNYFCYGCGFQSNTLMKSGTEYMNEQLKGLPEIYKDLQYKDSTGQIWIPTYSNIEGKGSVFVYGNSITNWKWAAVKAVPILEEEQHKFPVVGKKGQFHRYKSDMSTMEYFEELDFMDALDYIEAFKPVD